MACIGNEALLLLIALRHRPDDPPGEEEQQEQHRGQPQQGQSHTGGQGGVKAGQTATAVQEDDTGPLRFLTAEIAVAPQEPLLTAPFPHLHGIFFRIRPVNGRNLACIGLEHLAVVIHQHREIAGLIGGLRGQAGHVLSPVLLRLHRLESVRGLPHGKAAVVGSQHRQNGVGVGHHLMVAHQIDAPQDQKEHHRQGKHGCPDKLAP